MKILPVIHYKDIGHACKQAEIARHAGADGVFLISHTGGSLVDRKAVAATRYVKECIAWVGVNMLSFRPHIAAACALAEGADALWTDTSCHSEHPLGDDLITLAELMSVTELECFVGTAFKYQKHDPAPFIAANAAREYGFIPTTSGPATGEAPGLEKIISMSCGTHGLHASLAVASGLTPENITQFAPYISHALVATGVSDGDDNFDYEKLCRFVGAARQEV